MQGSDPRKQLLLGPPPLRHQLSLVGLHFWICTGTGSRHRHRLRDALVFFFFHWRYGQSSTLSSEFFFYRLSQIQQQMKAVGNLSRLRCAAPSSAGIESEPVARDDLHFRMLLQPLRQLIGRALRQQVRYGSSFQIDQDRAVGLSLLPRPVIDTHHPQALPPCLAALARRLILRSIVSSLTAIDKRFKRNSAARPPVRWPTSSRTSSTRLVRRAQGATTSPSRSRKMACSHSRLRHRHRLNRNRSATRLP